MEGIANVHSGNAIVEDREEIREDIRPASLERTIDIFANKFQDCDEALKILRDYSANLTEYQQARFKDKLEEILFKKKPNKSYYTADGLIKILEEGPAVKKYISIEQGIGIIAKRFDNPKKAYELLMNNIKRLTPNQLSAFDKNLREAIAQKSPETQYRANEMEAAQKAIEPKVFILDENLTFSSIFEREYWDWKDEFYKARQCEKLADQEMIINGKKVMLNVLDVQTIHPEETEKHIDEYL